MVLGLLSGWLCLLAYRQHGVVEAVALRVDQLRAAQLERPAPKLSLSDRELQKRWASLKTERDFAWDPLFTAIERSSSPEIELQSFDPDKPSGQLTMSGEAKNQQALVAFLDALARQPLFLNVHLTHQQKKVRDRLETVTFELKASLIQ